MTGETIVGDTAQSVKKARRDSVLMRQKRSKPNLPGRAPAALAEPSAVLGQLNDTLAEGKPFATIVDDSAAQLLAATHLQIHEAARDVPAGCRPCLAEVKRMLDQIQVRLPPLIPDSFDLEGALSLVAENVLRGAGIEFAVEGSAAGIRLPESLRSAVLHIAREILTNVLQHAHARTVGVQVSVSEQVRVSLRDDGVGFNQAEVLFGKKAHGLGLLGIQERVKLLGGALLVISDPGRGTEIIVTLPLGFRDSGDPGAHRLGARAGT
jgi:signal transduction histidine kinase